MKIVVLGGYGVFGSRLAELLVRDGETVVVVGRDRQKAEQQAAKLGCEACAFDVHANPEALGALAPDVVIDAVGPFQAYGGDVYHLAKLCLEIGADYLDLSDSAQFTAGIEELDDAARAAGRRVLSGVSSVPGLSSVVASELTKDMHDIHLIEIAILPGNRAPRGTSVMSSILSQLGQPVKVWRGGRWQTQRVWSDARRVVLAPGLVRTGHFIEVPDVRLFPNFFSARSVMFRAGMELSVLNRGMQIVAAVRRFWPFEITAGRLRLFQVVAQMLERFGTDRGGMRVDVIGRVGDDYLCRTWCLTAEAGEGPYIPAVAARAVVRNLRKIAPGARAGLSEVSLYEMQKAFADLSVDAVQNAEVFTPHFQRAFGEDWSNLRFQSRYLHNVIDVSHFNGEAKISRGRSLPARLTAWFFGFPNEAEACPVTVTKTREAEGELWVRTFGAQRFQSRCAPAPEPGRFRERFGAFLFEVDLEVVDGEVTMPLRRGWVCGVPLPRWALPKSETREFVAEGRFNFDVSLRMPFGDALIVRYQGYLEPVSQTQ
ncbi:SDR family oxidoreductase [Shimia sp. MMG029]|uniref:SDR family oxidoreductase n=1 Tax=Shimia sp. MMG029 TaxID=3021978 RepID=UPI0022FEE118|nr:SDR family oxidoreductase [Shimia sp. MMG029]MDA5555500.1 DUF4166 domain-containing protein [Shimia sp. MMG029]